MSFLKNLLPGTGTTNLRDNRTVAFTFLDKTIKLRVGQDSTVTWCEGIMEPEEKGVVVDAKDMASVAFEALVSIVGLPSIRSVALYSAEYARDNGPVTLDACSILYVSAKLEKAAKQKPSNRTIAFEMAMLEVKIIRNQKMVVKGGATAVVEGR